MHISACKSFFNEGFYVKRGNVTIAKLILWCDKDLKNSLDLLLLWVGRVLCLPVFGTLNIMEH